MGTEENKAILRRFYDEVVNAGNMGAVDQYIAADAIEHEEFPGLEGVTGVELVKRFVGMFRAAFPDLRFRAEDMIAEGDKVVARVTITGTHQGELMGIPPTGKQVTISAMDIVRVSAGKMVEHWGSTDSLGLLQQLGAIPGPGEAGG